MADQRTASTENAPNGAAPQTGTRLSETYADLFTLILDLRAARGFEAAEQLRPRVKQLLDDAERRARAAGFTDDTIRKASFALVAFLDETVHSSDWAERTNWQKKPLQLERFDRYDAGEEFFAHLESLRADPHGHAQVLEVYYLCLVLGFQGRYQLQGQDQLQQLIENTNEQLRRADGHDPYDALAPHGRPGDQTAAEMQSKVPAWAVVVGALVLALILYLGMSLYVSAEADEAVRTLDQVQQTRAQPS